MSTIHGPEITESKRDWRNHEKFCTVAGLPVQWTGSGEYGVGGALGECEADTIFLLQLAVQKFTALPIDIPAEGGEEDIQEIRKGASSYLLLHLSIPLHLRLFSQRSDK